MSKVLQTQFIKWSFKNSQSGEILTTNNVEMKQSKSGIVWFYNWTNSYTQVPAWIDVLPEIGSLEIPCIWYDLNVNKRLFDERSVSGWQARIINANKLTFRRYYALGSFRDLETDALQEGKEYHFLLTWDATEVKLYQDNELVDTQAFTGIYSWYQNNWINIWWPRDTLLGTPSLFRDGTIWDVQIWNIALDETQRNKNYEKFLARKPLSTAKRNFYYPKPTRLNEDWLVSAYNMIPSKAELVDISGNSNNWDIYSWYSTTAPVSSVSESV